MRASLTTVEAALTAAAAGSAKAQALGNGMADAVIIEISRNAPLTPNQKVQLDALKAEFVAEAAAFATALAA